MKEKTIKNYEELNRRFDELEAQGKLTGEVLLSMSSEFWRSQRADKKRRLSRYE